MELNMPGWMVSPLFWKSHKAEPHARAAKREKYCESGGTGFTGELANEDRGDIWYGEEARGMKDETTRDTT